MSGGRVLVAAAGSHKHELPSAADFAWDSVAECGTCGRRFVRRVTEHMYECWTPLRWYHFRARRLLAAASRGGDA